jgi:hypothetical protein
LIFLRVVLGAAQSFNFVFKNQLTALILGVAQLIELYFL